jgi:cellobiose-specific phosphotransferase system component IIA
MSELQKRVEKADSDLREKHYEHTKLVNISLHYNNQRQNVSDY